MKEGIDEQLDKAVDTEIKQFLAGFNGNYADAEKAIKKMGMDWKSFQGVSEEADIGAVFSLGGTQGQAAYYLQRDAKLLRKCKR